MYSGEPSLIVILLMDCWLYIDSAVCASSIVDGCGPIGLIVSYKDTVVYVLHINIIEINLIIYKIDTFGVACVSGAITFVTLLVEFLSVIGVLGVIVACISCGIGVELASSLQCLNLRGADVSTRSTSDPDDSLSHSEHCLYNCNIEKF